MIRTLKFWAWVKGQDSAQFGGERKNLQKEAIASRTTERKSVFCS